MKATVSLLCCLVFMSCLAYAGEPDMKRQLAEKDYLQQTAKRTLEQQELYQKRTSAPQFLPDNCLSAPLPTNPKTPNYSVNYVDYDGSNTMTMTFWRETCSDGVNTALMLRATPTKGTPFLCGVGLIVLQDGIQHNEIILQADPGAFGWCDDLYVPTTFAVNEHDFGQAQFDPAKAMTIIYVFYEDEVRLNIPAATPQEADVSGTTDGFTRKYKVICKDTTTGQTVRIPMRRGNTAWDCGEAGLVVSPGDNIRIIIKGTAK